MAIEAYLTCPAAVRRLKDRAQTSYFTGILQISLRAFFLEDWRDGFCNDFAGRNASQPYKFEQLWGGEIFNATNALTIFIMLADAAIYKIARPKGR